MWVHKFILLVAVAFTVDGKCKPKEEGCDFCPPLPPVGNDCPGLGDECVPVKSFEAKKLEDGTCSAKGYDEYGHELSMFVEHANSTYGYAHELRCSKTATNDSAPGVWTPMTINFDKWFATEKITSYGGEIGKVVFTAMTLDPHCPMNYTHGKTCLEGKKCLDFFQWEVFGNRGLLGHPDSFVISSCMSVFATVQLSNGTMVDAETLTCDKKNKKWMAMIDGTDYETAFKTPIYCLD